MKCPHCGQEVTDESLFCGHCGAKVIREEKRYCPQCHQEVENQARFCNRCGYDLSNHVNEKSQEIKTPQETVGEKQNSEEEVLSRVAKKANHKEKSKKNNKIALIITAIITIAVIAGAVWFFFIKGDDSQEYNPDDNVLKTQEKKDTKKLKLETTELEIYVGEVDYIDANIDCTYKSEDSSIAKVNSFGMVTGVSEGETTIKVKGEDGTSKTCTVTVKASQQEVIEGDYVIADSQTRELTEQDLQGKSAWELRIARNEIYARHGRKFTDATLQQYFEGKSWYHGTIESDAFDEGILSAVEKKNAELISAYEKAHPQQ